MIDTMVFWYQHHDPYRSAKRYFSVARTTASLARQSGVLGNLRHVIDENYTRSVLLERQTYH